MKTRPFAKALGWSAETLARVERGVRDCDSDELQTVSLVTGVPLEFLQMGFAPTAAGNNNGAITELRAAVTSLVAEQMRLRQELQEIRGTGHQEPPQTAEG